MFCRKFCICSYKAGRTYVRVSFGELRIICVPGHSCGLCSCLARGAYPQRLTHVRETTSLGGEMLLSWGDNPREGGRIAMLIPLPLLGFLPQSPTFLLPHPPGGCDAALHIPRMLHKTVLNKSCAGNRGKVFRRLVSPKSGEGVEKRAREKTVGRGENKQLAALSPLPKRLSLAQRGGALSMPPGLSPQDKGRAVMLNPYG